jgi:hypothetical protein
MLERLHLRPELTAFEQVLRRRVEHLAALEDERFARPAAVERDPASGELTVLAEFVAGSRLSDLLDTSSESAVVPGVDVALGYLLEGLAGLSALHTTHRVTHGLIDPTRTLLRADGQVVFLDVALGSAIEGLGLSPAQIWNQFGVGASASAGTVRFDSAGDVTQVALSALMLILGRNLRPREYPDALPTLLLEVIEVAQIRGSSAFAKGLQRFFERALPLTGHRRYATADEALVDVRQLSLREIGADVCRQAVIDFVDQMEAAFSNASPEPPERSAYPHGNPSHGKPAVPELDKFLDDLSAVKPTTRDAIKTAPTAPPAHRAGDSDDAMEMEISLDNLDAMSEPETEKVHAEEVYDLSAVDPSDFAMVESDLGRSRAVFAERTASRPAADEVPSPFATVQARLADAPPPVVEVPAPEQLTRVIEYQEPPPDVAPVAAPPPVASEPATVETRQAPQSAPQQDPATIAADGEFETESEKDTPSSRRKKRKEQRSARARKDKLRSTTAPPKMPVPEPPGARPSTATGWLVSPQRSADFEHAVPEPIAPAPRPVALPSVPSFTPSPVGSMPQPVYSPHAHTPAYGTPMASPQPPAPSPLSRMPAPAPPPSTIPVKVKANTPVPVERKSTISEPTPILPSLERPGTMAPMTLGLGQSIEDDQPRAFPWKLAAVALIVAVIAIVVGRSYLPGRTAVVGEPGAQTPAPTPAPVAPPATEQTTEAAIPGGRGRVVVQTQPPGIKVLVDRKPVGETPLSIDLPPGRRMLTFQTTGGEVMRSVRVIAGKVVTLDIPVFSGWLAVIAPVQLDIAENGQSVGTTEQNRLTLPPGTHELTFSNKDLGYSATQTVEIEPGGVKSLTIEPKGTVNLNANPWSEVWLDGQKLGDTPLVTQVPIGIREFVFKHPQHGERRVSATIRATGSSPVSVDFTK